jgi:cystathionine beta-lyase
VAAVHYPGLAEHPAHQVAKAQMRGFGGMLAFEPTGGPERARRVMDAFQVFSHAVSLGGVEALACFPSLTSHAKLTPQQRAAMGVSDSLIRLSTGVEDPADLVEDLRRALDG